MAELKVWVAPAIEELGINRTLGGPIDNQTEGFIVNGVNAGLPAGQGSYPNP